MNGIWKLIRPFSEWDDPENVFLFDKQLAEGSVVIELQVRHLNFVDEFASQLAVDRVPLDFGYLRNFRCRVFIGLEDVLVLEGEEELPP